MELCTGGELGEKLETMPQLCGRLLFAQIVAYRPLFKPVLSRGFITIACTLRELISAAARAGGEGEDPGARSCFHRSPG